MGAFVPNEWNYIAAAYALTWVTLIAYAISLSRRARRAERAMERTTPAGGE